jgi:hypothetical protein
LDAFDAARQGGADLQEDWQFASLQLLLGQTKLESTVRYLGIESTMRSASREQVEL